MHKYGTKVAATAGELDIHTTLNIWKDFCDGKIRVLLTTDISSRCVGTDKINLVINFDVTNLMLFWKVYQYRAGRTSQFGSSGAVITLLDSAARAAHISAYKSLFFYKHFIIRL